MTVTQYSAEFDDLDATTVDAREGGGAEAINASVQSILTDVGEQPEIVSPQPSTVDLPSGGDAMVRELNGEDEEALSKINRVTHTAKFMAALLERGVEQLNGEVPTGKAIKDLLLGDREALILAIRVATFGPSIEFANYVCPGEACGESLDVDIDVSTIPSKKIAETSFEVDLWKGGTVEVRMPNGHDQEAVFDPKKTPAEQNTELLARCVLNGNHKTAKALGVKDRRKILDAIVERTGGPQYNDVTFTHKVCGTEVPVVITAGDLFQDI